MVSKFTSDLEKTFQYQDSLPSLPAPDLDITLTKYLESAKPHLSENDYRKTTQIVREFASGVGKTLHETLLKRIKGQRNWLEKIWEDKAYLETRTPTNPYINIVGPAPYVRRIWPPKEGSQVERSALLIYHFMQFWDVLRKQKLRVDKMGKTPFCMNQYKRVFNSCRTPGVEKDQLHLHFKTEEEGNCPSHFVIICKGRFFYLRTCTDNYELLTPPEIQKQLQFIRDKCDREPAGPGLGALTCTDRTTWAKMYNRLVELHPDNQHYLKLIQTSVSVWALDDSEPAPINTEQEFLKGLGGDARHRWSDKLTSVVFSNGTTAYNVDHAPYDGMMGIYIQHFTHECLEANGGKWNGSLEIRHFEEPKELTFHMDDIIMEAINQADLSHQQICSNLVVLRGVYRKYGRDQIKKLKLHPDFFCQLALQLAYYRLHGKPAPTYETASSKRFWHGRTETLRVSTCEMVEWTKAMMDNSASTKKKMQTMQAAYMKHMSNMVDCSNFKGCDRHLLALQTIASEQGLEMPAIYTDKAYTQSGGGGNFTLSTSFVGHTESAGACAAMLEDGYGAFYSIEKHRVNFNIAGYKTGNTDCYKFFDSIKQSLDEMLDLVQNASPPKASRDSKL